MRGRLGPSGLLLFIASCGTGAELEGLSLGAELPVAGRSLVAAVSIRGAGDLSKLMVHAAAVGPATFERTLTPVTEEVTVVLGLPKDAPLGRYNLTVTLLREDEQLSQRALEFDLRHRILTNHEACPDNKVLRPPTAEDARHWAATRLEAPPGQYEVVSIEYILRRGRNGDVQCNPELAHRAGVMVVDGPPPADSLEGAQAFDIGANPTAGFNRIVRLSLDPIPTIQEGQSLYIAVQFAGDLPDVTCLSVCDGNQPESTFISTGEEEPFNWIRVDSNSVIDATAVITPAS